MTAVDALLARYRRRCDSLLDSGNTLALGLLVDQHERWEATGATLGLEAALRALDTLEQEGRL